MASSLKIFWKRKEEGRRCSSRSRFPSVCTYLSLKPCLGSHMVIMLRNSFHYLSSLPSRSQSNAILCRSITLSHEPSPQQQERRSLRDTASRGGNPGQSPPKLLSPTSALDRERGLPAGHKEDGSESSSSMKVLNERAAHADSPNTILDMSERRAPSPLDEASPERHTASASITSYREEATISISLPKKENVRAVAISSSALQVAVLCKHSVYLYSTIGGGRVGEPVDLSPKVNWTKIRLSSRYFIVYGLGLSHEKHVSSIIRACDLPVVSVLSKLISKD